MKNGALLLEAIGLLSIAQAGEDRLNADLRARGEAKLVKAKHLPRKQKKRLKKDGLLDIAFSNWNNHFNMFGL